MKFIILDKKRNKTDKYLSFYYIKHIFLLLLNKVDVRSIV